MKDGGLAMDKTVPSEVATFISLLNVPQETKKELLRCVPSACASLTCSCKKGVL